MHAFYYLLHAVVTGHFIITHNNHSRTRMISYFFYSSVFLTSLVPHPRTLCADIVAADVVVVVVVVVVTVDVDGADVGALPSLGPSPSWTSLSCA